MKVFLDANVVIDFLDNTTYDNKLSVEVFRILRLSKSKIYVSPTTFAITYYKFSKLIFNKKGVNKRINNFFKLYNFTTENNSIMQQVLNSEFADLEDALQYFSAIDSKIEILITKNKKDFDLTKNIIVLHPREFVEIYYN
jgi:predicted nucleic acid-binding protein